MTGLPGNNGLRIRLRGVIVAACLACGWWLAGTVPVHAEDGYALWLRYPALSVPGHALQPEESSWAALRDVQREVVDEEPRSGLAVTSDIGDRYDIHLPSKQQLRRRLALVARRVYGGRLPPSGRVPLSARREGNAVLVRFGHIEQGLVAHGGLGPIGAELSSPAPTSCFYADARIDGDRVLLRAGNAAIATRVRPAWADGPVVPLFERNGLPAGPFQIDIQQPERERR